MNDSGSKAYIVELKNSFVKIANTEESEVRNIRKFVQVQIL